MKTQFVTDNLGNKLAVILPIKTYKKMLEDIEDVKLYDEVKARKEEAIPFDNYLKKRRQKNNG